MSHRARAGPASSAYTRPALVVIGVVTALTVGFASWWTPFGWSGYGPRLQLPWVPPLVLIVLVAYGEDLARVARRLLGPPWRLVLVWAVALTLTLPHIGLLWDFNRSSLGRFVAQEQPECAAPWRSGLQTWHRCQHRLLWEHRPMPLYTVKGVETAGGTGTAVVVALGLLGCAVLLRRERRPRATATGLTTYLTTSVSLFVATAPSESVTVTVKR